jgi:LemA protein
MLFSIPLIVGFFVLVAFVFWAISGYNGLVELRNRVANAFAQIDVQLKRRYDLIPNLVETAKGYLAHERDTLEAVMKARSAAMTASSQAASGGAAGPQPGAVQALASADGALTSVLTRFFAVAEAYPNLKADTTMRSVMEELTSTENKVAFSRQAYNDSVLRYNTATEVFPSLVIARMFNFQRAALFEVSSPAEREAPKVKF